MSYANILCILSGARDDDATLLAAGELAKREKALVKVIPSLMLTDAVIWADAFGTSYLAASAIEEITAGQIQMRKEMAALARRTAKALGLDYGRRAAPGIVMLQDPETGLNAVEGDPMGEIVAADRDPAWRLIDREGPLADLVVVGEATVQGEGFFAGSPGEALLRVRAPMLVVRAADPIEGGVIAIAWDGSLAAGRAVHGALPLLRAARRIVILQDPDGMTAEEKIAGAPERLIAYLRHARRPINPRRAYVLDLGQIRAAILHLSPTRRCSWTS